jgi:aspartyl-tRNA(Asn)/glutamyl-tRNA(Gln) amidotransferase subunit C
VIQPEEVEKIASLARLALTPEEKTKFASQLTAVLQSFKTLEQIPTDKVEPLITPSEIELVFRADQVVPGMGVEAALANAPEKSGHLFKVPPVV